MNQFDFLIIGGGIAGTTAAEEIRSRDSSSSVAIITEETDRLYSRVLLPHFLRNENTLESVFVRTQGSYLERNISLKTSTRVSKIDTDRKNIETASGEVFAYKKLLIASGGKVNKLSIPGADLPEVSYLRTLKDAQKVRDLMSNSQEAVVLGGGFIGIEFAQSFVKNGLKTTAVIRDKFFWEKVVGEASGQLLSKILNDNGVTILVEEEVAAFNGSGKLSSIKLNSGKEIRADIAGVGIGIHMDLEHLKNSGLRINKGVVTNEYLETSVKDVWAAGDIAEFYDPALNRYHNLGNWANASAQGRAVGINMTGERLAFATNSLYSISIFGINFSFLGDPVIDERTEVIERGSVGDNKIARILLREDVIVGASLINMPLERNAVTKLIKNKTKIASPKNKLADLSFDLSQIA